MFWELWASALCCKYYMSVKCSFNSTGTLWITNVLVICLVFDFCFDFIWFNTYTIFRALNAQLNEENLNSASFNSAVLKSLEQICKGWTLKLSLVKLIPPPNVSTRSPFAAGWTVSERPTLSSKCFELWVFGTVSKRSNRYATHLCQIVYTSLKPRLLLLSTVRNCAKVLRLGEHFARLHMEGSNEAWITKHCGMKIAQKCFCINLKYIKNTRILEYKNEKLIPFIRL